MTNFINRIDKFVTVHRKRSKIPPSTSVHFPTRVWRSRVLRQSWASPLFMRAAAYKMPPVNSSPVSTFLLYTSLSIQPHEQKLNGFKQLSLGHHTALYTCLYIIFFSQWPIPSRPRILSFPPERACVAQPYIKVPVFPDNVPKVEWSVIYNSSGFQVEIQLNVKTWNVKMVNYSQYCLWHCTWC